MPDEHNKGQQEPEYVCVTCLSKIKKSQKKCIECDSYQDWRRHFQGGENVITLLVALISVLGIVIPSLASLWESHNSEIHVSKIENYIEKTGDAFYIQYKAFLTNTGDRPAA